MKHFFDLLYHGFAGFYDFIAATVSLGRWNEWVFSIIPYLDCQPVVELGHGPGHLQKRLLSFGWKVVGLDESRQMSALARKRLDGYPFKLIRADAGAIPFKSETIPNYVATFPSEYIASPAVLSEIRRTLKPEGKVVILLAAWPGGSSLPEKAVRALFRVTGESPSEGEMMQKLPAFFLAQGFTPQVITSEVQKSHLLIIILNKK